MFHISNENILRPVYNLKNTRFRLPWQGTHQFLCRLLDVEYKHYLILK